MPLLIVGLVSVLFVSVCVPVSVVTVESIFKVTSPVVPPPDNPVPAVTDVISPTGIVATCVSTYALIDCCVAS